MAAMAFIAFCKAMRLLRWMVMPLVRCVDAILCDDSVHDTLKIVLIGIVVYYGFHFIVGFIAFYKDTTA